MTIGDGGTFIVEEELVADFACFLEGRDKPALMIDNRTVEESAGVKMIKNFITACDTRLKELHQTIGILNNPNLDVDWEFLEQERNTWSLLGDLFALREQQKSNGPSTETTTNPGTMSDRAIVSLFQSTDPDISESVVVKEWLERVANYETVELVNTETTSYLAATAAANQQQQQQKQVFHELDPDGPVRSNRPLDPEDVRIKGRLTRNLFELVRRGEMGKALDLCRSCNEHWRAASLAGGIYYNDPKNGCQDILADGSATGECPEGNRNRGLWMMTCFQIANEASFDPYERALYAALCGNTVNILPVCKTWEDMLWAHFNSLVVNATENHLRKFPRIRDDEYSEFTVPVVEQLTVPQIFDRILNCTDPGIATECGNLFRQTQTAIILNRFDELMAEFDQAVYRENNYDPKYLRFFTHVILVMKFMQLPINEKISNGIVALYVDWLIETEHNELAMLYASRLPYDLQVQRCAQLLQRLRMPVKRREPILKLAYSYGLDVKAIAKAVAENSASLEETPRYPAANTLPFDYPLQDRDQYQIDMFLWLLFERDLALQSILHCNALYRRFLIDGKLNVAYKLYQTLLAESPYFGSAEFVQMMRKNFGGKQQVENFLRELTGYGLFLDAMHKYSEWQSLWSRHIDKGDVKFFSAAAAADLKQMTNAVEQAFRNVLQPNKYSSWLQDDEDYRSDVEVEAGTGAINNNQSRQEEMVLLRQVYIPQLVFALHELLFETRDLIKGNLRKSLELATLVASEDRRLYLEFLPVDGASDSDPRRLNRCEELLARMRSSQLEKFDEAVTAKN